MAPEKTLLGLGFTELEAFLYCALLREAPATGYRLAKAVGKAPANAYQALDSLAQKGAVMVDEGASKSFRPVPPGELLASLQVGFEAKRAEAAAALDRIERPVEADRIYQIKSAAQIYDRALRMIAAAEDIILFDLFPRPFARLRAALTEQAASGITVAGLVYEAPAEPPPFTALTPGCDPLLAPRWPGEQLTLVTDAREHLVALLARGEERVVHGVWSDSRYLSCLQHNGLASEIRVLDLAPTQQDRLAPLSLLHSFPTGLRDLLRDAPASLQKELS